jgi:putative phosphoribosyl transferase
MSRRHIDFQKRSRKFEMCTDEAGGKADEVRPMMANRNVIDVSIEPRGLEGIVRLPKTPSGLIIFAHGSGSSRFSPRNNFVAEELANCGFAVLLFDLLTLNEAQDRRNVFDIPLLSSRVNEAIDWATASSEFHGVPIGLFGASTGAAAALVAAATEPQHVRAVVSRGGRPDLAAQQLPDVKAPTLLIVGGLDTEVLELNRYALQLLQCEKRLDVVPGATHLFEEPGTLEAVVSASADWFTGHVPLGGSIAERG